MFAPNSRVGVAVSGGADSVCSLHVLHEIRARWNLTLTVFHINHLLRGPEADEDEQFVRELAGKLDLEFSAERINVRALAVERGSNLEQTARDVRRSVFLAAIQSGRVDRMAVAHTRSDQAETVLFRLLRGSYTTGLAGMRPVSPEGIVRPLLFCDRAEIEEWLRAHGMSWREDRTNADLEFARNRIRHELLPSLAAEWNPRLPELLAQHTVLAQEDEEYWEAEVDRIAPAVLSRSATVVIADIRPFLRLPNALARRVIRRAFLWVRGDLRQIDFRHIDDALNQFRLPDGHARTQVPGVDILRSFDWVRFAPPAPGPQERDFDIPVRPPASIRLPGSNAALSLEVIERQDGSATLGTELDWNRIQSLSLLLRNWRPGDAYQRVGHHGEHKLKALFHEARIPLWDRRNWPVLIAGDRIVWSKMFGAAHDFAANPSSRVVLRISEANPAG
jgi:tRNA(Ile)-lysidine synthase